MTRQAPKKVGELVKFLRLEVTEHDDEQCCPMPTAGAQDPTGVMRPRTVPRVTVARAERA
jgi:hypothetical protein